MNKHSLIYFGTPDFSAHILEELIKSDKFDIKGVVTQADKPVGRKQVLTSSPVSEIAKKYNLPILDIEKIPAADFFVVVAFGKMLPQHVIDLPTLGCINVHPSHLPKYRGASPLQETILHGDSTSAITIMLMEMKMDAGPILTQQEFEVASDETFESLSQKVGQLGAPLLIETLEDYAAKKVSPQPQDESKATYCRPGQKSTLVTKEDGFFDIANPPAPEVLDRMIRAYYPWPNVWTKWNNKVVKFYPEGIVQMEGKNKAKLKDFLRGYPEFPIKEL